jgi:hypothetical protein
MSTLVIWILIIGGVLLLLGVYLSWTAGRLDRLHARVDASRAVLDAELLRRSASALELATANLLDPATSVVIADAGSRARTVDDEGRHQAESDLTAVLGAALDEPEELAVWRDEEPELAEALGELGMACRRAGPFSCEVRRLASRRLTPRALASARLARAGLAASLLGAALPCASTLSCSHWSTLRHWSDSLGRSPGGAARQADGAEATDRRFANPNWLAQSRCCRG